MKSLSRRLIKPRACAMLVTLLCESAKIVLKMNSVILILFLGATVAFAEISVENDPHHHKPRCPLKVSSSLAASEKIRGKDENQQQTQPTYDTGSRI